jgi:hypothetical protein
MREHQKTEQHLGQINFTSQNAVQIYFICTEIAERRPAFRRSEEATAFFKVVVASTVFTMPLPRPATPDAPGSA